MARYIDADEAKEALTGWDTDPTDEEIEWTIDNVPTADVAEVKHGNWVDRGDGDWSCDRCGELFSFDAWGDIHPKDDCGCNYCPNCGAKMDGGEE
jgi:hypothetical protein